MAFSKNKERKTERKKNRKALPSKNFEEEEEESNKGKREEEKGNGTVAVLLVITLLSSQFGILYFVFLKSLSRSLFSSVSWC